MSGCLAALMGPGTSGDSREPRKTGCLSAPHTHPLPLPPVPRAPSLPQAKPPDSGPWRLLLGISTPHLLQACHPPRNKNHAECEVTQSRGPTSALAGRGAERVASHPEPQSPACTVGPSGTASHDEVVSVSVRVVPAAVGGRWACRGRASPSAAHGHSDPLAWPGQVPAPPPPPRSGVGMRKQPSPAQGAATIAAGSG